MKQPSADMAARLLEVSEAVLTADPPQRLEDVANAIGASRASLYYYFSGRDDLVTFLVTQHAQDAGAALSAAVAEADPDPRARLAAGVDGLARFLADHPGLCGGILGATGAPGRLQEVLAINQAHVAGPLADLVAAAWADGPRPGDPHLATTVAMGGLLLGVLGHAQTGGDPTDRAFFDALIGQVLAGLLPLVHDGQGG